MNKRTRDVMLAKFTHTLPLLLLFSMLCCLSSCDLLSDLLDDFSPEESQVEETAWDADESFAKTSLLEILDSQQTLIEDLHFSKSIGEKQAIKDTYEEILRLEQQYQDEFSRLESELSAKETMEISSKHREIINTLPSFSSLMQ